MLFGCSYAVCCHLVSADFLFFLQQVVSSLFFFASKVDSTLPEHHETVAGEGGWVFLQMAGGQGLK